MLVRGPLSHPTLSQSQQCIPNLTSAERTTRTRHPGIEPSPLKPHTLQAYTRLPNLLRPQPRNSPFKAVKLTEDRPGSHRRCRGFGCHAARLPSGMFFIPVITFLNPVGFIVDLLHTPTPRPQKGSPNSTSLGRKVAPEPSEEVLREDPRSKRFFWN